MSMTHVNVCSNSVECWVGIQSLWHRLNTVIIMLYTVLSVGKHTPLQCWMREPVSHVIPANTKHSANVGILLAPLNQQLSWHTLPVPPPSPIVDQLSGAGKNYFDTLFMSANVWSTDCDAGLTVEQHLVRSFCVPSLWRVRSYLGLYSVCSVGVVW